MSTLPRARHTSRPRKPRAPSPVPAFLRRGRACTRDETRWGATFESLLLGRDVCRVRGRVDTKIVSLFLGGDLCHRARVWERSFLGRDICRVRAKCYKLSGPGRTGFESGPSSGATYVASEQNAISSAVPAGALKGRTTRKERTTRIRNRTTEVRNRYPRAPGAPQARKHRLCCDRETKLACNKKEAPAAADILPHQACPENATARPNRHCYVLWAPFGGK